MDRLKRKPFDFNLEPDLREALEWKAHQLHTTMADVLRRYLLIVKEEREAFLRAMVKEQNKRQ